jgi:hypothetical protein
MAPSAGAGAFLLTSRARQVPLLAIAAAFFLFGDFAWAQTIDFELHTFPESPVIFADSGNAPVPGIPRRQFVTVRNQSKKSVAAVMFEQSVANGSKTEIVALERVSILFAAGEKRRVSVAVAEVLQKMQSGEPMERPVLSVVAVEFMDGSHWTAPTGSDAHAR